MEAPEFGSLILDTATKKARVTTRVAGGAQVVTLYDPEEWQRGLLIPPMIWSHGMLVYTKTLQGVVELAHVLPLADAGGVMDFDKGEYQVRTQRGVRIALPMKRIVASMVSPGVKLLLDASKLPVEKDRVDGKFVTRFVRVF